MDQLQAKIDLLADIITRLDRVMVAYSGGCDSTLLLAACLKVLGKERVLAVTADSPTLPRRELTETRELAQAMGANHLVITTDEMCNEQFTANPPNRCYYCKQELFTRMREVANQKGYQNLVYGATADDQGDIRPGMQAAREAGARAPLLEAGFRKEDVRRYARLLGLNTWDKPAMACLSSRFPYGESLTLERLKRVELAEEFLRQGLGFKQVRVRDLGSSARIEVDEADLGALLQPDTRYKVVATLKELGYTYVTLNLEGFRSGSMNDILRVQENTIPVR